MAPKRTLKILFLSKRRPMDKDLMKRPYGRFYYLPKLLSEKGHTVYVLLLSYRREPSAFIKRENVEWFSTSIIPHGPLGYYKLASGIVCKTRPDWIIGFSDTYYGILAEHLGNKFGIKSGIDAYDNYESYIPWLKPLHHYWRKAISNATVVTSAGPGLSQFLNRFRPDRTVHTVPMAADPAGFKPLDRDDSRRKLRLPLNKKLIGYSGSIFRNRGIEVLFRAFDRLRHEDPEVEMVLSGRKQKGIRIPEHVTWLGYIPDSQIPLFINSIDVLAVINKPSNFGKYSYPVKLYEAMRCRIPVVATDTPAANWILNNRRNFLSSPDDPEDLAEKIKGLLPLGRYDYGTQNSWPASCHLFEQALFSYIPPESC